MAPLVWVSLSVAAVAGPSLSGLQAVTPAAPQTPRTGRAVSLTSVRVRAGASGPIVSLEADGPLPMPTTGVLQDPPRVYFDLTAVTARAPVTQSSDDVIARVRVALHSADPVVTRVVIDLKQPATFSVDASSRPAGRIDIALQPADVTRAQPGAAPAEAARVPATAPSATAPSAAAPSAAAPPATAPPDAARRAPADVRRYLTRVTPLMQRLDAVRPVLASIDSRTAVPADRVDAASVELALLRDLFASIRPPHAMASAHGMLMNACSLGSTALSLVSVSKDGAIPWNASSAAAGTLILLDRARAELPER